MLDCIVAFDAGGEMRVVLAGLQQAVRYGNRDQARQCQDEDGEELGLQQRQVSRTQTNQSLVLVKGVCVSYLVIV